MQIFPICDLWHCQAHLMKNNNNINSKKYYKTAKNKLIHLIKIPAEQN